MRIYHNMQAPSTGALLRLAAKIASLACRSSDISLQDVQVTSYAMLLIYIPARSDQTCSALVSLARLFLHDHRISAAVSNDLLATVMLGNIRNDAANGKGDPNQTAVSERFPTVHPTKQNDRARFEMPHDRTTHWTSFVDDHELREIYETR